MNGARKTSAKDFETMGLTPPEIKLWKALEAGEACIFDEGAPEHERTLRGDILGGILRRDAIEGCSLLAALPRQVGIAHAIIIGELDISDTQIDGGLAIVYCRFEAFPDFSRSTFALLLFKGSEFLKGVSFQDLIVKNNLGLEKIKCVGRVTLQGSKIGGQLSCVGANISAINGEAIYAQGAEVKADVSLSNAKVTGCVNFSGSKIEGEFSASDAYLSCKGGSAINAQGAQILGGVFLRNAKVFGCVKFTNAKIGGQFSANGAHFSSETEMAINAQGVEIASGVYLGKVEVAGRVDFSNAKIEGEFSVIGARFLNSKGKVIQFQGGRVRDVVWLTKFPQPPIGVLDFTNADFGNIIIDENSFPLGRLHLNGTRYRAINDLFNADEVAGIDGWLLPRADPRSKRLMQCYTAILEYLSKQSTSEHLSDKQLGELAYQIMHRLDKKSRIQSRHPFAYRQFARVLKANGHEAQARAVRIEAEHALTEREKGNRIGLWRVWRWFIKSLISYGIEPWRVLKWVLLWWAVGSVVFWLNTNHMTPAKERFYLSQPFVTENDNYVEISPDVALPKGYPKYSPIMYSLDVMLPVVDFAQESHWRPKNTQGFNWLRNFNRIFLALGWALSTIAVLGFTGVIADRPIED